MDVESGAAGDVERGPGRRLAGRSGITEYFIDGADTGEKMMVGFEFAPNPDGCNGDPGLAKVDGATPKGKYLFSIILSAHSARQAVSPKFEGCDVQGRPILTGLKVSSN